MPYSPEQFEEDETIDEAKINSLRIPELIPNAENANKFFSNDGVNFVWASNSSGGGVTYRGLFFKSDPSTVVFQRTGLGAASIKAGAIIDVGGSVVTFTVATAITMPTLTAGTDYSIWLKNDGTLQASANFQTPPASGTWRQIGGFHYAPGGNAPAQSGGDTTPQINEYSFWDLKFRPACPDPRGMTLVANSFWSDIYFTGHNAVTLGLSSALNQTIADALSLPVIPQTFGGNGTNRYTRYTWFEAQELAMSFGKRCPTQPEFAALAYGTTEATHRGGDPVTTQMSTTDDNFTSKWGVIQSTGCVFTRGREPSGTVAAQSWSANTGGRGSEYGAPGRVVFSGDWIHNTACGSRCHAGGEPTSEYAAGRTATRFVCSHLISE